MAKEIVITSDAHSKVIQAAHFLEDNLYGKLTTAGSALEDVGSFLYAWKAEGGIDGVSDQDIKGMLLGVQALGSHINTLGGEVEREAARIRELIAQDKAEIGSNDQ